MLDPYGDVFQHSVHNGRRHNRIRDVWYRAIKAAYGDFEVYQESSLAGNFSPDYKPDIYRKDGKSLDLHHIYELKVASALSRHALTHGQHAAFGGTEDFFRRRILGEPDPNTGRYHGADADYAHALRNGHVVEPIIMETFGGFTPSACKLIQTLAKVHGADLGSDSNAPWCARSFKSIYIQRLSVTLQRVAAEEIFYAIRNDSVADNSA